MPAAAGLVDLGVLLALAFLIALSYAYRYSFGALLEGLAAVLGSIRLPGVLGGGRVLGIAADALLRLDHYIESRIGDGIEFMRGVWDEAISYTASAVHWIGHEIASLSHDTAAAVEGLAVGQVFPWVNRRLVAALAGIAALKARVLALEHEGVGRIEKVTHVITHRTVVVEHAIAHPGIGTIPKALPGIADLERWSSWARHDLRRLARYLTPAGIIGLVGATFFSGFGLGWLRCKGVGRVGRALCGMSGLIEMAALDALTAFAAIDLCWFVNGMQRTAESIRPLLLNFVDLENALIGRCGGDAPSPLTLADVSPTPVVAALTLKAL